MSEPLADKGTRKSRSTSNGNPPLMGKRRSSTGGTNRVQITNPGDNVKTKKSEARWMEPIENIRAK